MSLASEKGLFCGLVSSRWYQKGALRKLKREFKGRSIPYVSLPHFLKPEIAAYWFEELQKASYKISLDHFGLKKWPSPWEQHFKGKVTGRWGLIQGKKDFLFGHLVETLFLSNYFSRYLSEIVGSPTPLRCTGLHHKRMGVGDWENPHSDSLKTREITMVYYVTQGWEKKYGGSLVIGHLEKPLFHILPGFNELLLMKVSHELCHGVGRIGKDAKDHVRYSSIYWFK